MAEPFLDYVVHTLGSCISFVCVCTSPFIAKATLVASCVNCSFCVSLVSLMPLPPVFGRGSALLLSQGGPLLPSTVEKSLGYFVILSAFVFLVSLMPLPLPPVFGRGSALLLSQGGPLLPSTVEKSLGYLFCHLISICFSCVLAAAASCLW